MPADRRRTRGGRNPDPPGRPACRRRHNDQELAGEIARQLAEVDNPDRWQVSVQAGVADIEDFGTDTAERAQASRLAAAVPGVVRVRARHQTPDPF